ncbi:MAG: glycosyltransferase, partial [Ilumatobacteraceae bacterium]
RRRTIVARAGRGSAPSRRDELAGVRATVRPIARVVVAIPARDEAGAIAACLASIAEAVRRCPVPVCVTVAADACHDDTAAIARSLSSPEVPVHVVEGRWLGAGRARAAAIDAAMTDLGELDPATVWIVNTDADCIAAPGWLQRHVAHAAGGAHAVAGTVGLDSRSTPTSLLALFTASYELHGDTHRHVHAANLGVRADAYRAVGGWSRHTVVGEDHELWRRLQSAELVLRQPTDVAVVTSHRTIGRVHGGFASALAKLERRPLILPTAGA